jgi:hypothetical protein
LWSKTASPMFLKGFKNGFDRSKKPELSRRF